MILLDDKEGSDQTAQIHRQIWAFAVNILLSTYIRHIFAWRDLYMKTKVPLNVARSVRGVAFFSLFQSNEVCYFLFLICSVFLKDVYLVVGVNWSNIDEHHDDFIYSHQK